MAWINDTPSQATFDGFDLLAPSTVATSVEAAPFSMTSDAPDPSSFVWDGDEWVAVYGSAG